MPVKDMWSKGPVIQDKISEKHMPQEGDKNCQVTICENTDSKSQISRNSDKNCQENIRPRKPRSHMQSVTNNTDVQLPKPTVPYEYSRLCKDKNCQSTRCYKCQVIPMYNYDKKLSVTRNNLNLKELCYYQFHMQTAIKTNVMQSGELIANGLYTA